MDKEQALHSFWSQFCTAYEENSVPDNAVLPYITYQKAFGDFDQPTAMTGSIYTRSTSWRQADSILNQIDNAIKEGGQIITFDDGKIYFTKGTPFAQTMGEDDRNIKRYVINLSVKFFTR